MKLAGPLVLGCLAVLAGAAFLWDVGALPGMVSRNVAAFLLGLALGWVATRVARWEHGTLALFLAVTGLLAYVLWRGIELDGVRRWLAVGPVSLQPALILAPLLLILSGSVAGRHWRIAVLAPLALIAAQPDAATSVALAGGVVALMVSASRKSAKGWSTRRLTVALGALGLTIAGLFLSGIQTPPPVAFVEGTAGIAALSGWRAASLHFASIGLAILAVAGQGAGGMAVGVYLAIAAVAATFWAFPMPIAGAGPSHLIGFGIAVAWLASPVATKRRGQRT